MATGNGILRKMSGSVGDLTYRVVNGQQTVAARVTHVKNLRTEGQMGQRTRVTLKLTDATLVLEVMPACAMGVKDGFLAIGTGLPEGAFAWVHSLKGAVPLCTIIMIG